MRLRKFMIVVVELFLVLTFFKFWERTTGLGMGSYLLLMIFVLLYLNYILAKFDLMGDIGRTFIYKIFSRMAFTKDWFGIFTMFAVVFGFFTSRVLFQSAFLAYVTIIVGLIVAIKLLRMDNIKNKEIGLLVIGLLIGVGIGSKYAESWFIIFVFVVGNLFLYLSSVPTEKEHGLQ